MPIQFEAATEEDLPAITRLLREAFQSPADAPNLNPDLLRWKYFEPGPEWEGSRSYVLRNGPDLLAHASLWPVRLATPSGLERALCFVDWVSAKTSPGAGILLVRKFQTLAPILLSLSYSDDTRKVMPRLGFKERGELSVYARVLRPWRQFATRPSEGLKGAARLVRNAAWSAAPLASPGAWTFHKSDRPDDDLIGRLNQSPVSGCASRHSPAALRHLLRCPPVRMQYFTLNKAGTPSGYLMLARAGGQCRIADLRILSEDAAEWTAAYAAAVAAAADDPESAELVALGPTPMLRQVLQANRFQPRGGAPVLLLDPENRLAGLESLHVNMLDDDRATLHAPDYPYIT